MTPAPSARHDRTLRAVMWMDAFLSLALVAVGIVASPVVAILGVPTGLRVALGVLMVVCAVLLAAFGAITAICLMRRMRDGQYLLPPTLRLPLPGAMRPRPIVGGWTRSCDAHRPAPQLRAPDAYPFDQSTVTPKSADRREPSVDRTTSRRARRASPAPPAPVAATDRAAACGRAIR